MAFKPRKMIKLNMDLVAIDLRLFQASLISAKAYLFYHPIHGLKAVATEGNTKVQLRALWKL